MTTTCNKWSDYLGLPWTQLAINPNMSHIYWMLSRNLLQQLVTLLPISAISGHFVIASLGRLWARSVFDNNFLHHDGSSFLSNFLVHIFRCKPVSEIGAEQVWDTLNMLRTIAHHVISFVRMIAALGYPCDQNALDGASLDRIRCRHNCTNLVSVFKQLMTAWFYIYMKN